MTFCKRNQHWLVGLGATVTLLWTAQFAAGWFKPHSELELAQHKKIELAHTIQFERHENTRAFRLESKTDPIAIHAAFAAHTVFGRGLKLSPDSTAARIRFQTTRPPAIRAPPYPFPYA